MVFVNYKVKDNAIGQLQTSVTTGATSITLKSGEGANFPSLWVWEKFLAVLVQYDGSGFEESNIVKRERVIATARSGDVVTITRWDESDTPLEFDADDYFIATWRAKDAQDMKDEIARLETDKLNIADYQNWEKVYAASSWWTDSYAITLSPAISSYTAWQVFKFQADVGNTGTATLNVNGLWAKTIKKRHDMDLETGDIEAWQIVTVAYDWTNFQMDSQLALVPTTDIDWTTEVTESIAKADKFLLYNSSASANHKAWPEKTLVKPFGWSWADWSVDWSAWITITWSNDTYIEKNYESWAAAQWWGKTCTVTPTWCIVHIKVAWDADLTDWTFNFADKWKAWWSGESYSGWRGWLTAWTDANWLFDSVWGGSPAVADSQDWWWWWASVINNGSQWWWSGGAWWTAPTIWDLSHAYINTALPFLIRSFALPWAWGGGGAADHWFTWLPWWNGGRGWWALIIEVAWDLTLNSTTVDVSWADWWTSDKGWWGGGGWWCFVCLYAWTLTDTSKTITVTWGSWWTGTVANGWAWGAGTSVIEKINIYA